MSAEFSLTTFNSEGKLKQIENALKAVANGETCVGVRYAQGVVLVAEKNLKSTLVDERSMRKLQPLADHIGAGYAGLSGDFRVLAQKARKEGVAVELTLEEPVLVAALARTLARIFQEFTQSGGVRSFGISLLLAGVDADGPQLFQIDPSGVYLEWKAAAVGKGAAGAKAVLEKRFKEGLDRDDAINIALLALKDPFEGTMSSRNVEIGFVAAGERVFRSLGPKEVSDCLGFIAE